MKLSDIVEWIDLIAGLVFLLVLGISFANEKWGWYDKGSIFGIVIAILGFVSLLIFIIIWNW